MLGVLPSAEPRATAGCCNGHETPTHRPRSGLCSVPELHTELTGGAPSSTLSVTLSSSSMCTLLYLPFFPVDSSRGPFLCSGCCTAAVCVQRRMLELGLNVNQLKVALRKHRVQITGCESPDGKRRILSPWCTAESAVLQPCFLSQSLLDNRQLFPLAVQCPSILGYFSGWRW